MARPIVLSNGEMHVGLNLYGLVHDFTYPRVGQENHTIHHGTRHRVGVWIDGSTSWLDDEGAWTFKFGYDSNALVGTTTATSADKQVTLHFTDHVNATTSSFVRRIRVENHADTEREVRLFMHQAFVIGDSRSNTDTVQYLPDSDAIVHYRGRRVFVVSGQKTNGEVFDQYTVGLFGIEGREGTFRDADDGELSGCTVEHGRVDSTIRFSLTVASKHSEIVNYWISAGTSMREALLLSKKLAKDGAPESEVQTKKWWKHWLAPVSVAKKAIPAEYHKQMTVSAMVLRSQIDNHGAVIASTDSAMLNYGRDAYGYCWPRDGAYVMWPLIRLGYTDEPKRFFAFCRRGLHPSGYLQHKYFADDSLGPSWHSYVHPNDVTAPPIQTDETALTLFVFAQYYQIQKDDALLRDYYDSFVVPMAEFLASYIDHDYSLPNASYDLWEEVFMTTTYTTAVTYAALAAAADLADTMDDATRAVQWRTLASDMRTAAHKHLFNEARGVFYKGITLGKDAIEYDDTIDSSAIFGAFMFGLYDVHSEHMKRSIQALRNAFDSDTYPIGFPRYEHDTYGKVSHDAPSNIWHITTLWYAQYCIETGNVEEAKRIVQWVQSHAYDSGVLAEQIQPHTKASLSVAPLTWSHAEYMATVLDMTTEERAHG